MDVTPELIETVDFPEKFRGYDQDAVDAFLVSVGEKIVGLSAQLDEANRRVHDAQQAAAAATPTVMSEEEEAAEATRTLMFAKRTADAAIADARSEAAALVDVARTEADATLEAARSGAAAAEEEARRQAETLVADAHTKASGEFEEHRTALRAEIDALEHRKLTLVSDVEAMEARVAEYRGSLDAVAGRLNEILADPELLMARTPLDVDMTPVETVVDTTGHEAGDIPPVPAAVFEAPHPAPPSDMGASPMPEPPLRIDDVAPLAETFGSSPESDLGATGTEPPLSNVAPGAPFDDGADPLTFSTQATDTPSAPADGSAEQNEGGDPWVPGSWSSVMEPPAPAAADEPAPADHLVTTAPGAETLFHPSDPVDLFEPQPHDQSAGATAEAGAHRPDPPRAEDSAAAGSTFAPAEQFSTPSHADVPPPAESASTGGAGSADEAVPMQVVDMEPEPPTGSFGGLSQDRYLRDLDAAVNSAHNDDDTDAMSVFLMGDDEKQARRFGRRR